MAMFGCFGSKPYPIALGGSWDLATTCSCACNAKCSWVNLSKGSYGDVKNGCKPSSY